MLNRFAFRAKMLYLCTSEEERAPNTGFSPLFLAIYKGRNTSGVENSICFCGFSKCFCGNFLGFIGERIDDVEIFSSVFMFCFGLSVCKGSNFLVGTGFSRSFFGAL